MKVLSLDISTNSGWAYLELPQRDGPIIKMEYGNIQNPRSILEYGPYPECYYLAAEDMASKLFEQVLKYQPDVIVVEEINLGKNRYTQRSLEWIHCLVLDKIRFDKPLPFKPQVVYLSSSMWRQAIGLLMSKTDKKNNAKLSKAKKAAAETGSKLDKSGLGILGKIGKKHLSVRWANETFGLSLKMKDNDIADALGLAVAYTKNAVQCDGT